LDLKCMIMADVFANKSSAEVFNFVFHASRDLST
jgi:hypothetical protein